jgi:hypothetical protein
MGIERICPLPRFGVWTGGLAFSTGPKIRILPMDGFENYLTSAIVAKKVPITVVLDKDQADYVVNGSRRESNGVTSGNGSLYRPLKARTNYSASISIIDPKSSTIIFSYAVQRSGTHSLHFSNGFAFVIDEAKTVFRPLRHSFVTVSSMLRIKLATVV